MNKLLSFLAIAACIILAACSDDQPSAPNSPSYRDGTFAGNQLTVTLDGQQCATASSVTLTSSLLDANLSPDKGPNDVSRPSDPTYTTTVTVTGFPKAGDKTSFVTVSNLRDFQGVTEIQGVEYEYTGEFTGGPLLHHDNQGLILKFTTK